MGNHFTQPISNCCDCSNSGPKNSNTTVVNKRKKRTRLGKDGLAQADQTNLLLDKWKASDVQQLMRVFKKNVSSADSSNSTTASATNADKTKGKGDTMNRQAFFQVFSELQSLPASVAGAAFDLFDKGKTGTIDFREFCTAVAICCLSSKKEQVNFVFDLFDGNRDGKLTMEEVKLLLETAVTR